MNLYEEGLISVGAYDWMFVSKWVGLYMGTCNGGGGGGL